MVENRDPTNVAGAEQQSLQLATGQSDEVFDELCLRSTRIAVVFGAEKIGVNFQRNINPEVLIAANGRKLTGRLIACVELIVGIQGLLVRHEFYVIDGLNHNVLIGLDFMQITRCKLYLASATASFFDDLVVIPLQHKSNDSMIIRTIQHCHIPSRSEALIPVLMPALFRDGKCLLLEPHVAVRNIGCFTAKAVVQSQFLDRRIMCHILNPSDHTCLL